MINTNNQDQINQEYTDNLASELQSIKPTPMSVNVQSTSLNQIDINEPAEETEELQEEVETEEVEELEETEKAESGFEAEFLDKFGVDVKEAKTLFTDLMAMRDEMSLMRHWQLSPAEYSQRMNEVREFFSTLPEDKQSQFDNVEGAISIWQHLNKDKPENKQTRNKMSKASTTGVKKATVQTKPFYSRQQILNMSKAEYDKNLPDIQAAYFDGRITD